MKVSKNLKQVSRKATTLNEKTKPDETAINEFIEKINIKNIIPPKLPAKKLVVEQLNREGTPKRPMNRFFCFRRIFYLEVVENGLLSSAKDGVFLTNVASRIWNDMTQTEKDHFKNIADEIKILQSDFHKGKHYNKKPVATTFHNYASEDFDKRKNKKGVKDLNRTKSKMIKKKKQVNVHNSQSQKNHIKSIEDHFVQTQPQKNHIKSIVDQVFPTQSHIKSIDNQTFPTQPQPLIQNHMHMKHIISDQNIPQIYQIAPNYFHEPNMSDTIYSYYPYNMSDLVCHQDSPVFEFI
ncbi:11094_t:CDS:1 [Funneliformis caledonium]|uniref:11094_t:CDS:1 n=1 Tax=Funneliformis caledonium TaxID=1117310 RepID=A0A9N9EFE0_9GLOM|nr:11094_t:CDS:1 [Funneliformis caledonium]